MKPRTRFLRMFNELPKEARKELVYNFVFNPMTLNVIAMEIKMNTKLGKEILEKLGYKDETWNRKHFVIHWSIYNTYLGFIEKLWNNLKSIKGGKRKW